MDPIEFLDRHQLAYTLHEHPPVFTCEEAAMHCADIPGMACKNLFLKDSKNDRYYLVIMPAEKKMDLKLFRLMVAAPKIRFADESELMDVLKLTRGSVSPFGLLNDKGAIVRVYIDNDLWEADIVSFHPNRNGQTLEIRREMFHKFFEALPHHPIIVRFP